MTKQQLAMAWAVAVMMGGLAGCPPAPVHPEGTGKQTGMMAAKLAKLSEAPVLGFEPVSKGVFISMPRTPLDDAARVRAKMTRNEILAATRAVAFPASTHKPASISTGADSAVLPSATLTTMPASGGADDVYGGGDRGAEAPPMAVKYYLQGREKFLEGSNSEAMGSLENALNLDPQAFTVLRLMGRVCFAASQLARGATFLERAQAIRPQDVEVNYLLGRYWLERGENEKAAFFLMQAEDSPDRQITSTQTPLSAFYLGIALQQAGYHMAAAKEFEHFLEVSEMPVPGYRYDAELSYLINTGWSSQLSAAENYARVGDYHAALPHYEEANAARPEDAFIASRMVNAMVHDGQSEPAEQAAMKLLAATHGSEDAVKLLGWAYRAAGREGELVGDLRAYLQNGGKGSAGQEQATAITISSTLEFLGDKAGGRTTLLKYLESHPTDLDVVGRMIKHVDSEDSYKDALWAAARAIDADRTRTEEVVRMFVPLAEGPMAATYVNGKKDLALPAAGVPAGSLSKGIFAAAYLEGLTRQSQNQPLERVEEAYAVALNGAPDFFPAVETNVTFLLSQEKFAQASSLIDAVMKASQTSGQSATPAKAWQLQINAEEAQQRYTQALQLAQQAKAKFSDNIDLRMELVQVYRLRGQDKEADVELQALIQDKPKYETAYRSLVNSLFTRSRRGGPNDAGATMSAIVGVLNKLAAEIPDSRFGRITTSIIYARGGRYEEAETMLRTVLATDPDQAEALIPLAQIEVLLGHVNDGVAILQGALNRKPQMEVVRALANIYREEERKPEALALTKRSMDENPDSDGYLLLYATELVAQDKRADALRLLTTAVKKFPRSQGLVISLARLQDDADDHEGAVISMRDFIKFNGETTERLYLLSHFYSAAANDDAAVAALQRVLSIMPDNIGANNDLGYFWANAGIHLDQAEPMIRKALENRPDDPAFMDSLGWVYYKQGKFSEAMDLIQKAASLPGGNDPEVLQHLGDTMYRLGRGPDAIEKWKQALQQIRIADHQTAADRKKQEYLSKVVNDAQAGNTPAVSATIDTDAAKSATPATAPMLLNPEPMPSLKQ